MKDIVFRKIKKRINYIFSPLSNYVVSFWSRKYLTLQSGHASLFRPSVKSFPSVIIQKTLSCVCGR